MKFKNLYKTVLVLFTTLLVVMSLMVGCSKSKSEDNDEEAVDTIELSKEINDYMEGGANVNRSEEVTDISEIDNIRSSRKITELIKIDKAINPMNRIYKGTIIPEDYYEELKPKFIYAFPKELRIDNRSMEYKEDLYPYEYVANETEFSTIGWKKEILGRMPIGLESSTENNYFMMDYYDPDGSFYGYRSNESNDPGTPIFFREELDRYVESHPNYLNTQHQTNHFFEATQRFKNDMYLRWYTRLPDEDFSYIKNIKKESDINNPYYILIREEQYENLRKELIEMSKRLTNQLVFVPRCVPTMPDNNYPPEGYLSIYIDKLDLKTNFESLDQELLSKLQEKGFVMYDNLDLFYTN